MIYKKAKNLYVAECIDLDLMVKAKSLNKAEESLLDAIQGYLAVACQGDSKGLVPRLSPIDHRVLYHWVGIRAHLARLLLRVDSNRNETRRFAYPDCHAAA